MTAAQASFELDTVTVPCTPEDLRATFSWLLMEMRSAASYLRADERDVLRKIMAHTGTGLRVRDVFPHFEREGEAHKTLRRLRATQFIYPKKTGRWEADEPIAVTPFARKVWDHLGEKRLFAPPPALVRSKEQPAPVISKEPPADTRTPPPRPQTPLSWDNLLTCIQERQKAGPPATGQS
jgi:hypothetical protein